MALVDFYQQSLLFNLLPPDPHLCHGFQRQPATRFVADGDPANDLRHHSVFVDTKIFIRSILHAPADWKTRWAPAIRVVKENPDFIRHHLQHCALHKEKRPEPAKSNYQSLVSMHDATLHVAFPTNLTPPYPPSSPAQLIHIVDDGTSGCVLNKGNSIPRLIAKGKDINSSWPPPTDGKQEKTHSRTTREPRTVWKLHRAIRSPVLHRETPKSGNGRRTPVLGAKSEDEAPQPPQRR